MPPALIDAARHVIVKQLPAVMARHLTRTLPIYHPPWA